MKQRKKQPHILLTNDDGIHAEGIHAIYQSLSKSFKVTVAAPDSERSSIGHAITLTHPLWYKKVQRGGRFFGYSISGTPADCVKLTVSAILKHKPDLVISGINCGDNDGCSVFYSGTVAAAREGALMGIPAMAISLASFKNPDFRAAAKIGTRLAAAILRNGLPSGTFLNVNVPDLPAERIKGIRYTRQGQIRIHERFHKRINPHHREYFWMTGKLPARKKDLTFDTYALYHGFVTVTPIQCDMTDYPVLKSLESWKV